MSGAAAVNHLLSNSAGLIAEVPAARVLTTPTLPLGTALPAITITSISRSEHLTVSMAKVSKRYQVERVQVMVHTTNQAKLPTILELVRRALPNTRGAVNTVNVDGILPDLVGPDLSQPEAGIFAQSRDFIVRWSTAAS